MPLQYETGRRTCDPAVLESTQAIFLVLILLLFISAPLYMSLVVFGRGHHAKTVPERLVLPRQHPRSLTRPLNRSEALHRQVRVDQVSEW